jgi:hypothetical protein
MPATVSDNLGLVRSLAALAVCGLVAACGSTSASRSATGTTVATHAAAPAAAAPKRPKPKPPAQASKPPSPAPGSLPQTHQLPSAETADFHFEMAELWRGIVENSVRVAMPAFFPERAYVQLKAVADPAGDYQDRLVPAYRLDIAAAHAVAGPGARLVRLEVPSEYAHWIPPSTCDNRIGYYELPNSRIVYESGGAVKSFGIASMISWRGVWYVVHLGSVLSPGSVDDASSGAGVSAPSSTC